MLLLALGLALTLTLTLALAPAKPTLAASITGGSTGPFLAFTVYDSCPSGWVAYNTYTARTIKAMRTGAGLTAGNTFSAGSGDQVPSHSHSATGSLSGSFPGVNGRALITNGNNWVADQGTHYLGGFGVSSQDGQTPFVTLQLCRYTGATTLWAADGLITFVTNDVTDCPSGWTSSLASFEPNGRFITFAAPGVNPFASSTGGVGDSTDVGSHSHSVPGFTMGGISQTTCCSWSLSGGGNRAAYSSTFNWNTDTAGTTGSSLNIPYVTLRICRATPGAPSPSPIVLPDTQLFFLAETAACPTLFTEVTATFSYLQGRLPWLLHSAGGGMMRTMRGTQFPRALSTSGAETAGHSHTLSTSYTFRGAGWASATGPGSGGNSYNNLGPYGASWGSGSTAPGIPYLALRACRPSDTSSPTRQPTNKPTTRSPTGGPTTSYPTYSPSRAPTTSKPSAKPSRSPSRAPTTSKPSASPTTSKPSSSPTTSAPSRTPSRAPTLSPTPAPVWVNVCSGNDQSVFQNYDNYVLQRGACAELCNVEFLKGVKNGRECALAKCSSIDLYTTLCKQCIVDEINCQTAKCKVSCQAYRYSDTCAACTNDNCRSQFQRCSGLQGSSVDAGGGDGGSNKPPPISNIPYGLIGGVIGGVIGGLGLAFFAVKRWRERGVTTEMTTGFERRIFGRTAEEKSAALAAARAAGGDDELVSDNPNYRHASRGAAAVKITGTRLRAKYSFHGDEDDEVDVPAGAALTAIERSAEGDWYVVKVDETGAIGCIPASYTVNAG